jgi:hypothetical protein
MGPPLQKIYYLYDRNLVLNVFPKEGDPPGRPYKNLYYFYERNLVSYPTAALYRKSPPAPPGLP